MKHFYGHLVELDSVFVELEAVDLSEPEKDQLGQLIDANLHQTILETILAELSEDDKKELLDKLNAADHGKIWEYLNSKTENIESKIKTVAEELKSQLHSDIKEARRLKK